MDEQSAALSARLLGRAFSVGGLDLQVGAEAGYIAINGLDQVTGNGTFAEPFAGLEYHLTPRWSVHADLGPTYFQISSQGESVGQWQWTYNTALYCNLF